MIQLNALVLHKEFLLVTAAFTGTVLFFMLRSMGQKPKVTPARALAVPESPRVTTLSATLLELKGELKGDARRADPHASLDRWAETAQSSFRIHAESGAHTVWEITLFDARVLAPRAHARKSFTRGAFEVLAHGGADAEELFAPLVKKIVSKTRAEFGVRIPINASREKHEGLMLSTLPHESALYEAATAFLVELASISREIEQDPSIEIRWGETFTVAVRWKRNVALGALRALEEAVPEITCEDEGDDVVVSLSLAFTPQAVPRRLTERTSSRARRDEGAHGKQDQSNPSEQPRIGYSRSA